MKRQRGRNRSGGAATGGGGTGKPQHNANRAFDSNGPDSVKIRGHAQHVFEKYQQLARDSFASGDRVLAENYLQHADHYFRVLRTIQPQRPPAEILGRDVFASGLDIDFEDESEMMDDGGDAGGEGQELNGDANRFEARGDNRFEPRREERYEPRPERQDARADNRRDNQDARFDPRPERVDNRRDAQQEPRREGQEPRRDGQQDGRRDNRRFEGRNGTRDPAPRDNGGSRDNGSRENGPRENGSRENAPRDAGSREFRDDRRDSRPEDRRPDDRRNDERRPDDRRYGVRVDVDRAGEPPVAETPAYAPAEAVEMESSPVLRSEDGGVSEAPAFLQAAATAPQEDGEARRPRARRRRPRADEAATPGDAAEEA